eukprot:4435749-Pyramimonas_sp.AAC.1
MQYWRGQGWTEYRIRHLHSLRNIKRGEDGEIIRSKRTGPVKTRKDCQARSQESCHRGMEAL